MQHRILSSNGLLHISNQNHVTVVVFLKELKVQTGFDFSRKNGPKLFEACLVGKLSAAPNYLVEHAGSEGLLLFVDQVKSNLVGDEVLFVV